ncbi:MAG: hypothetical protein JW764_06360 [Chlorobiaceae bacterium]|nr:hypothetical protein [Chlorobiaceae bacterium]
MKKIIHSLIMTIVLTGIVGCASTSERLLDSDVNQVHIRSIQTRAFDTSDKEKTLRTIIATLQDLGFVIDKADLVLGSVSGTKLDNYSLKMTVTVRPRGEKQLLIRANAQYNVEPVVEAAPYQNFFTALEKSMFLTAQQVD